VASQLLTGVMLAFSLVLESSLIPIVREEEDLEVAYIDDFFWLHERGVDFIFIFGYLHLLRKLYLASYDVEQEIAWKSGVFVFLVFQAVTFFGLLLCSTHLSEITLTIAANIFHTIFNFYGSAYWWIFTDKSLNTDTLIRLGYFHYISAFYMFYIALLHGIDLHYDWKNETTYDGVETELVWWDEALSNELGTFFELILLFIIICFFLYPEPEAVSYELFMWGDIGIMNDVRFYGVAPHWYFRPFMAWLIACPNHITGVIGLFLFFLILFYQPTLHGLNQEKIQINLKHTQTNAQVFNNLEISLLYQYCYASFILALLYTSSFLPYGRFYNKLGGSNTLILTYVYILIFLLFNKIRTFSFFSYINFLFLKKIKFLCGYTPFYAI
jgi:quinol-cytochrome oxidoreductase complex cytochrome b subunit